MAYVSQSASDVVVCQILLWLLRGIFKNFMNSLMSQIDINYDWSIYITEMSEGYKSRTPYSPTSQ